jgi:GH25 family lysozyme M1 (1,4-beta-N-acetylmuramidase)
VKLYGIVGMCNAMVSDYESDGDKYTMTFGNVSDEQPFFTAVIYFKDEASMQNCRETCKSLTEDMQAALHPSSYIRKKNNS